MKSIRFAFAAGLFAGGLLAGLAPAAFAAHAPSGNTALSVGHQGGRSLPGGTAVQVPQASLTVSVNAAPALFVDPFALYRD